MKESSAKWINRIKEFILPEGSDIQVAAFNILAVCGIIVCVLTGIYNLGLGLGIIALLGNTLGLCFTVGVMFYTKKTGNYRGR